jgi:hypothetical protein
MMLYAFVPIKGHLIFLDFGVVNQSRVVLGRVWTSATTDTNISRCDGKLEFRYSDARNIA